MIQPGDKVKIKKDLTLLMQLGLEALYEEQDTFNNIYTVKYFSYGYAMLAEAPMDQYDISEKLLIKQ